MEPRFRGCKAIIVRSFARIHEANLKKQGVLALTFAEPEIYDVIGEDDRISILGLADLAPGEPGSSDALLPARELDEYLQDGR
jgi:aconitate hydratase